MKIDSPFKEIIETLTAKTKAGKVKWARTSVDNEFKASLPSGAVSVWVFNPEPNSMHIGPDADFIVYNNNGSEIKRISITTYDAEEYTIIENLHTAAYDSYLRKDETLSGLLNDINSL